MRKELYKDMSIKLTRNPKGYTRTIKFKPFIDDLINVIEKECDTARSILITIVGSDDIEGTIACFRQERNNKKWFHYYCPNESFHYKIVKDYNLKYLKSSGIIAYLIKRFNERKIDRLIRNYEIDSLSVEEVITLFDIAISLKIK